MTKTTLGYQSLAAILRAKVVSGEWRIGKAIPSEASLAKKFSVAVGTIRQAIAELAEDGVLIKHHGKSTAVSSGLNGQSMLRFFRYQLEGQKQILPQAKVLDIKQVTPDRDIVKLTGWKSKSLLKIHRIRLINGQPLLYEIIYLPLPQFKKLMQFKSKDFDDLFYPMYAKVCEIAVIKAKDQVSFELMKKTDAKMLSMKEGHPGVRVTRIAFDLTGKPVEYRSSIGDAMEFRYVAEVH
jgi:GntR family transcriptional regulator